MSIIIISLFSRITTTITRIKRHCGYNINEENNFKWILISFFKFFLSFFKFFMTFLSFFKFFLSFFKFF